MRTDPSMDQERRQRNAELREHLYKATHHIRTMTVEVEDAGDYPIERETQMPADRCAAVLFIVGTNTDEGEWEAYDTIAATETNAWLEETDHCVDCGHELPETPEGIRRDNRVPNVRVTIHPQLRPVVGASTVAPLRGMRNRGGSAGRWPENLFRMPKTERRQDSVQRLRIPALPGSGRTRRSKAPALQHRAAAMQPVHDTGTNRRARKPAHRGQDPRVQQSLRPVRDTRTGTPSNRRRPAKQVGRSATQ